MNEWELIAKAELSALALRKVLGVQPRIKYTKNGARLFYSGSRLTKAQNNFKRMLEPKKKTGGISVDFMPIARPVLVKKYGLIVGATILAMLLVKI